MKLTSYFDKFFFVLPLLFLPSCAQKQIHSQEVAFREPRTLQERVVYNASKGTVTTWIHPATSETLLHLTGYSRLKDLGKEFLKDIGGEPIQISTEDNAVLLGMYFDPKVYRKEQGKAFKKWRIKLAEPKNCKLSQIFEVNYRGHTIATLLSLPKNVQPIKAAKKRPLGMVCLPGSGLIYELDPQFVLTFLARGFHVLIINYRGIYPSEGIPDWKGTSLDAKYASEWLSRHLNAPYEDITIVGKSFGTGPAVYTATQLPKSNLILDRGFARLSEVCDYSLPKGLKQLLTPFAKSLVEKYYRFPNEDWLPKVKGNVLLIEATEDEYMRGQAERLFTALALGKTAEQIKVLKERSWIQVSGGHYGKYWGDPSPSWYSDEKSQEKLSQFLKTLF